MNISGILSNDSIFNRSAVLLPNQSFSLRSLAGENPRDVEGEFSCTHRMDGVARGQGVQGRLFILPRELVFMSVGPRIKFEYSKMLKLETRTVKIDRNAVACIVVKCLGQSGMKEVHYFYDMNFLEEAYNKLQRKFARRGSVSNVMALMSSGEGTVTESSPPPQQPRSARNSEERGGTGHRDADPNNGSLNVLPVDDIPTEPVESCLANIVYPADAPASWFSPIDVLKRTVCVPEVTLPSGTTIHTVMQRIVHDTHFLTNHYTARGDTNVSVAPFWDTLSGARVLTATIIVLRSPTPLIQGQRFAVGMKGSSHVLLWHFSSQTPKVTPGGSAFRSEVLAEFVCSNPDSNPVTTLTMYMYVNFVESSWIKKLIESNCSTEVPKSWKGFVAEIVNKLQQPRGLDETYPPRSSRTAHTPSGAAAGKAPDATVLRSVDEAIGPSSESNASQLRSGTMERSWSPWTIAGGAVAGTFIFLVLLYVTTSTSVPPPPAYSTTTAPPSYVHPLDIPWSTVTAENYPRPRRFTSAVTEQLYEDMKDLHLKLQGRARRARYGVWVLAIFYLAILSFMVWRKITSS